MTITFHYALLTIVSYILLYVMLCTEEKREGSKHLRFVQLYTSKSYEDRRSMLVSPELEEDRALTQDSDLEKHVLSPLLVDSISNTAQVLWANSQKREGLLGRSDVRLQTAVGMPVAVDGNGNMCVVVMFSPNHIKNTDDAMEYLQFISQSATSSSIPCLLPVFSDMRAVMPVDTGRQQALTSALGDGVTARFVNLDGVNNANVSSNSQISSFPLCFDTDRRFLHRLEQKVGFIARAERLVWHSHAAGVCRAGLLQRICQCRH